MFSSVMEVNCGDVLNAYITAPVTEMVLTVLRPEFGADHGKIPINHRHVCGLKNVCCFILLQLEGVKHYFRFIENGGSIKMHAQHIFWSTR